MSVISSRSGSIASILKGPGVRAKLVGQQRSVNFKLPKNLKSILLDYENGCNRKVYEDLVCILRDANIKVGNLASNQQFFHIFLWILFVTNSIFGQTGQRARGTDSRSSTMYFFARPESQTFRSSFIEHQLDEKIVRRDDSLQRIFGGSRLSSHLSLQARDGKIN